MKTLVNQTVSTPVGAFAVLAVAALLEVWGDACFQSGLYKSESAQRIVWFVAGSLVLSSYGLLVNLPQWDFGKLLGVYVVLFFLLAQLIAKLRFHQSPTTPVLVGGALIVTGGAIIAIWKP